MNADQLESLTDRVLGAVFEVTNTTLAAHGVRRIARRDTRLASRSAGCRRPRQARQDGGQHDPGSRQYDVHQPRRPLGKRFRLRSISRIVALRPQHEPGRDPRRFGRQPCGQIVARGQCPSVAVIKPHDTGRCRCPIENHLPDGAFSGQPEDEKRRIAVVDHGELEVARRAFRKSHRQWDSRILAPRELAGRKQNRRRRIVRRFQPEGPRKHAVADHEPHLLHRDAPAQVHAPDGGRPGIRAVRVACLQVAHGRRHLSRQMDGALDAHAQHLRPAATPIDTLPNSPIQRFSKAYFRKNAAAQKISSTAIQPTHFWPMTVSRLSIAGGAGAEGANAAVAVVSATGGGPAATGGAFTTGVSITGASTAGAATDSCCRINRRRAASTPAKRSSSVRIRLVRTNATIGSTMHTQTSSATIRIRASMPDRPHRSIWTRWTPRFPRIRPLPYSYSVRRNLCKGYPQPSK